MHKFTKTFLISIVFSLLYNLPIVILRNTINHSWNLKIIPEFILASSVTLILFYLLKIICRKNISNFLIIIFFIIGGISDYYLINFGRFIDTSSIIDILTVEMYLVREYISPSLFIFIILSFGIGWLCISKIKEDNASDSSPKTLIIIATVAFFISFGADQFNVTSLRYIMKDYLPSSIFYNTGYFFIKYLPHFKKLKDKRDLTKTHSFTFDENSDEPLIVVLIIGESMRGDLLSINGNKEYNNMPLLGKLENLISFPNAKSSSTSTHISLPFMLTSAIPPNFTQALGEKSIISIFKYLGFETSWIGNQGAFGVYESTFASNILEADFHVIQEDLRKSFKKNKLDIYDEHIIPILEQRLNEVKGNHFIVLHLLGSHWNFRNRYPESFGNKFTPICNSSSKDECSELQLKNSYHNTIYYSDYVLNEILSRLSSRKAFLIYASDHGFSLGERNLFGNAYVGENIPFEQISIGMFSWASSKFMLTYGEIYRKIYQRKSLNISHDYLFHSLLDCIRVTSDYIDKDLSLCR